MKIAGFLLLSMVLTLEYDFEKRVPKDDEGLSQRISQERPA